MFQINRFWLYSQLKLFWAHVDPIKNPLTTLNYRFKIENQFSRDFFRYFILVIKWMNYLESRAIKTHIIFSPHFAWIKFSRCLMLFVRHFVFHPIFPFQKLLEPERKFTRKKINIFIFSFNFVLLIQPWK
jgi:hypothetical protein